MSGDDKCATVPDLVECSYVNDGIGPSTFIGGASKDHLPIDGWQHTSGASPDKAEILNAYAAKAIDENDDEILYFGMDRYAVDGSTDIGFWFFRGPVVANPDGTFTGEHQGTLDSSPADNDILALATFTQGGAATNIRVFRWVGAGGNESGTINGPDAGAGDCVQDPPLTDDPLCGTVNDTTIEVPWEYQFKGAATGNWVPAGGFFEGGINLTELGLEGCFSSFLAETRSSPEITAILKDFTLGDFESCDTELTTTPKTGAGGGLTADSDNDALEEISTGTGSVQVKDSAVLDVKGIASFTGTLSFYLCGPIPNGACDENGVPAGSSTVTTNDTYLSDAMTVTSVGRYCWYAFFDSTTEGVPDASDGTTETLGPPKSTGECFEVTPVTPTLSTTAGPTVKVGSAVTDTATLGGTATQPGTDGPNATYPTINATNGAAAGGSITFTLRNDSCVAIDASETARAVSGDGTYPTVSQDPVSYTPASTGTYHWVASYSGSSPNTSGKSHNTDCSDASETVKVVDAQISIATDAVNKVGDEHTFTVTVKADYGDGSGFVPVQGVDVLAVLDGTSTAGSITGGTCDNTGGDTDAAGQCTVVVDSDATGIAYVNASANVPITGLAGGIDVATNGYGVLTNENSKTWADAQISIATDAVNKVGDEHTFTVTVKADYGDGSGFVPVQGVDVLAVLDGTSTAGSITGGTCDNTGATPTLPGSARSSSTPTRPASPTSTPRPTSRSPALPVASTWPPTATASSPTRTARPGPTPRSASRPTRSTRSVTSTPSP